MPLLSELPVKLGLGMFSNTEIGFPFQDFLKTVDVLWENINENLNAKFTPIAWVVYPTIEDLLTAYWMEPNAIPLAVIFKSSDPINGPLR